MGVGLRIEIVDRERNTLVKKEVFHDFPITIGRDPIANINLEGYSFITKFHAKLELWPNGGVMLRDAGSTNGTAVGTPTNAIPPQEWVDIRQHDMAFMIGPLHFTVERVDVPRAPDGRDRGGAMLSSVSGKAPTTARNEGAPALAVSAEARDIADELRGPYQAYRTTWNRFYERFAERLQPMKPETRKQVMQLLASEFPAVCAEPDFRGLAKHLNVPIADLRPLSAQREEDAALELLNELAEWYGVRPLVGVHGVIDFAKKLQDGIDVLCLTYVRLRDGLRTFQSQFDVEGSHAKGDGASQSQLETARTPREVGGLLLDWTNPADRTRTILGLIADLSMHEVGLVNGVAKGGAALIARLSPAAVLAEFEAAKRAGKVGFAWGGTYKKLWAFFESRHNDMASEEKEMFEVLFGREFAQAYGQVSANVGAEEDSRPSNRRQPRARVAAPVAPPEAAPSQVVAKTPENHGAPPKAGKGGKGSATGTVVMPHVPAPRPKSGPDQGQN
jgi:predicted component of type VI protein secretion system